MSTAQMVEQTGKAFHPCSCGCSDCQGECCALECLIHPNFFCGQLLTDRDLKVLVDWASAKSALQRFREGWGVVCGLEATCSHKDKEHNRVYVGEGYAVDCCGRDIVVCEPIWYDFQCDTLSDPCCREKQDPSHNPRGAEKEKGVARAPKTLGSIPFSELRVFDLCLVFDEQMTGGQRAVVRGNCAPMGDCQFTRVKETGKLVAKEAKDPLAPIVSHDIEAYRQKLREFAAAVRKNSSSPAKLLDYIAGKLHTFCFVEDWLCQLSLKGREPPEDVLLYIIQDFRNHYLLCRCVSCKDNPCDGDGVPLSRVWIWDRKDASCRMCKVVYIESHPPHRRPLSRACGFAQPGYLDVSRYIWHPKDEVVEELSWLGYTKIKLLKSGVDVMHNLEDKEIFRIRRVDEVQIHYYPDHRGHDRVVAFQGL